jgi:hypothetical protein
MLSPKVCVITLVDMFWTFLNVSFWLKKHGVSEADSAFRNMGQGSDSPIGAKRVGFMILPDDGSRTSFRNVVFL